MPSGQGLVNKASQHIGDLYRHVTVPKDDPNWPGPWDCSEFISWLVYQEASVLYGCQDDTAPPSKAKAYTGAWKEDCKKRPISVPKEKAAATVGGILLRYPPGPGTMGHIVLSDGQGGTIEAMGTKFGVKRGKVAGRRWDTGILLPEISYDGAEGTVDVSGPTHVFAVGAPNMSGSTVRQIQQALKAKGFDPGAIDGEFGHKTGEAVAAFQDNQGLIVDGEVGEETAGELGVDLTGTAPVSAPALVPEIGDIASSLSTVSDLGGLGAMGPLIPIALQLLPGLLNIIAGDKTGAVKDSISKVVGDITGATDPAAVRQKIASDPAVAAQLQLKLAEIAAEQEEKRNQAHLAEVKAQQDQQLAVLKTQQDQEAIRRRDELENLKTSLQDVEDARARAIEASKVGGPQSWAPVVISLIVTLGFFGIFIFLVTGSGRIDDQKGTFQLINLTLGALVAAFTTVVSFWLGSSQGSRIKDSANVDLQVAHANQTNELIKSQATTIEKSQATLEAARQAATTERIVTPLPRAAAKLSNFPKCVDFVLMHEGGFVNNPEDPGGATNFGIAIKTLSKWRTDRGESAATVDDVKNLTREAACEIYRTNFWNALRCDDLPVGVDLVTFDFGVNSGPGVAAKFLQMAVGAAPDGSVGSATIAAAKAKRPQEVIDIMIQKRLDFLQQLPTFGKFGRGWTNRLNDLHRSAMAMNESDAVA